MRRIKSASVIEQARSDGPQLQQQLKQPQLGAKSDHDHVDASRLAVGNSHSPLDGRPEASVTSTGNLETSSTNDHGILADPEVAQQNPLPSKVVQASAQPQRLPQLPNSQTTDNKGSEHLAAREPAITGGGSDVPAGAGPSERMGAGIPPSYKDARYHETVSETDTNGVLLPPRWVQRKTETGESYYVDHKTKTTRMLSPVLHSYYGTSNICEDYGSSPLGIWKPWKCERACDDKACDERACHDGACNGRDYFTLSDVNYRTWRSSKKWFKNVIQIASTIQTQHRGDRALGREWDPLWWDAALEWIRLLMHDDEAFVKSEYVATLATSKLVAYLADADRQGHVSSNSYAETKACLYAVMSLQRPDAVMSLPHLPHSDLRNIRTAPSLGTGNLEAFFEFRIRGSSRSRVSDLVRDGFQHDEDAVVSIPYSELGRPLNDEGVLIVCQISHRKCQMTLMDYTKLVATLMIVFHLDPWALIVILELLGGNIGEVCTGLRGSEEAKQHVLVLRSKSTVCVICRGYSEDVRLPEGRAAIGKYGLATKKVLTVIVMAIFVSLDLDHSTVSTLGSRSAVRAFLNKKSEKHSSRAEDIVYTVARMWLNRHWRAYAPQRKSALELYTDDHSRDQKSYWPQLSEGMLAVRRAHLHVRDWARQTHFPLSSDEQDRDHGNELVQKQQELFESEVQAILDESKLLRELLDLHNAERGLLASEKSLEAAEKSLQESREAIKEQHAIARLTQLAFFFLPLTFITGVFGMNIRPFSGDGSGAPMWRFWVTTCCILIPTWAFGLFTFWDDVKRLIKQLPGSKIEQPASKVDECQATASSTHSPPAGATQTPTASHNQFWKRRSDKDPEAAQDG